MEVIVTNGPIPSNDKIIIDGVSKYNFRYVPKTLERLAVYIRDEQKEIIAGLTGMTLGGYLHIEYIWVADSCRGKKLGMEVLKAAEKEAIARGCTRAVVDTFEFQALGFYTKQGYSKFGTLDGYYGRFKRYYLRKKLP